MMKKDISLTLADDAELKPHLRDAESILNSPDLGLLKLASPELERLIIQSNGMVTTTPTSSQFLYPKTVTDEQEFAEGFVKALEDLHKQNQLSGTGQTSNSLDLGANVAPVPVQPDLPVYTNLNSYGSGPLVTTVNYSTDTVPFPPPPSHHLGAAALQQPEPQKEEPQTVPDVQSFGDSPPLSPVDMDTQERIKAERKRLRNRIAASKCRRRKLERISRLEIGRAHV
ncbi:transcription factor jun-D isoform X2 [Nematolebias whitei]|uniref:transcription factor jun-D isoform X2 n=1 Tax=Nematolebias whitei TaxID=451745 RepID=UPI0018997E8A|nr:transcription factor jun-D isoform X2 [Nematolebias whitei]